MKLNLSSEKCYASKNYGRFNCILAHRLGLDAAIVYGAVVSSWSYFNERNQLSKDAFCYITVATLERLTTLKDNAQRRILNILVEAGLIEIVVRRNNSKIAVRHIKPTFNEEAIEKYTGGNLWEDGDEVYLVDEEEFSIEEAFGLTAIRNDPELKNLRTVPLKDAGSTFKNYEPGETKGVPLSDKGSPLVGQRESPCETNPIKTNTNTTIKENRVIKRATLSSPGNSNKKSLAKTQLPTPKDVLEKTSTTANNAEVIKTPQLFDNKKPKRNSKAQAFITMQQMTDVFSDDVDVQSELQRYYNQRKKTGLSVEQWEIILGNLKQYAKGNNQLMVQKIRQAFTNQWRSIVFENELSKSKESRMLGNLQTGKISVDDKDYKDPKVQEEFRKTLAKDEEGNLRYF